MTHARQPQVYRTLVFGSIPMNRGWDRIELPALEAVLNAPVAKDICEAASKIQAEVQHVADAAGATPNLPANFIRTNPRSPHALLIYVSDTPAVSDAVVVAQVQQMYADLAIIVEPFNGGWAVRILMP